MTITDRSFQRLVRAAMTVGFALLLIAGLTMVHAVGDTARWTASVVHTYEVEQTIGRFSILAEQLETARRGFIINRNDASLQTYRRTMHDIPPTLDRIGALTIDNPSQQRRLVAVRREAEIHRASAHETIARMEDASPAMQAMADFGVDRSFVAMTDLRRLTQQMVDEEERLLVLRRAAQDRAGLSLYLILGVTGVLMIVVMGAALWVVRRYTTGLNASQDDLRTLNTGLEDAVAARTAELSRANDEIQRFAYIVSHDLRSPLVNVMGFTAELEATIAPLTTLIDRVDAEAPALMTAEAREAKADLPEAVGFIRSSTAKMDRLINAILRLSREGRRTLQPVAIDLAALTASIRDSFAHQLGATGAEIDVGGPFVPLVSDRLALEQILSNLIENAVKYLDPDRPGRIAVTARREGPRVVIDVIDNGRGIAPADHERIFDLFRRAGSQDQAGEGLGLAHVRALSYRLGGLITCISRLGEGTTFRLSLPPNLVDHAKEPSR